MFKWILLVFLFSSKMHSFEYDLHPFTIPGNSSTIICFHGSGANYLIAKDVKEQSKLDDTIISFNFPDHDFFDGDYNLDKFSFGSIQELLPAFHILKKEVLDKKKDSINLYGFSAGGGALINLLAVLNQTLYDGQLKKIGITEKERQTLLKAIQKGWIILDVPLKSVEEILDFRGSSKELEAFAKQYKKNNLRPIDSLKYLENLSLNIIVHFQVPDEILSNRDDALYIERVKKYNAKGKTHVVIGHDGGHLAPHPTLWNFYKKLQ